MCLNEIQTFCTTKDFLCKAIYLWIPLCVKTTFEIKHLDIKVAAKPKWKLFVYYKSFYANLYFWDKSCNDTMLTYFGRTDIEAHRISYSSLVSSFFAPFLLKSISVYKEAGRQGIQLRSVNLYFFELNWYIFM